MECAMHSCWAPARMGMAAGDNTGAPHCADRSVTPAPALIQQLCLLQVQPQHRRVPGRCSPQPARPMPPAGRVLSWCACNAWLAASC